MLLQSDLDEDRVIDPNEALELSNALISENSVDAIWENAWILRALANNRTFLIERYHSRLKSYWSGDERDKFQPQSLELANNHKFYIRSNIWMPLDRKSLTFEFEQKLYAYEIPHDHNFQLLTVGYYGSGYTTDTCEYDVSKVKGAQDERVDFTDHSHTILAPGRLIFYRQNRDIHIQHTPKEMSASLNLSMADSNTDKIPQYVFDFDNGTISGGAGELHSNRPFLLDVFIALNDDNTVDILSDFVRYFDCPCTRAVAFQVLDEIDPSVCEQLLTNTNIGQLDLLHEHLARGNSAREYSRF